MIARACLVWMSFAAFAVAGTDLSTHAPGDGLPDGLCDVWQQRFGGWGLSALADPDGDGASNLAEARAGTDPWNPAAVLRTTAVALDDDRLVFTFFGEKAKRYRLASSDALAAWSAVPGAEAVGMNEHAFQQIAVTRPLGILQKFFRLEVEDGDENGDGVSDWAEWQRGTDGETVAAVRAEFSTQASERPIFAETFAQGSRLALNNMFVHDGVVSGAPGVEWPQVTYFFDDPPDVRAGDVTVYWAFKTQAAPTPEHNKLLMYLNFTDVPTDSYPEPARIAVNVRPQSWGVLYCDPGWQLPNEPELYISPPIATFSTEQSVEKFRLTIHWMGGDEVIATPAIWDRELASWRAFTPRDAPEAGPAVLPLSIAQHLLGKTTFKSLFFQPFASYPALDSVLVTVQP